MPIKNQKDLKQIRETINTSTSKILNALIFFSIFLLYILLSTLNTSDVMLLLPEHTFKMPLINFDLNLKHFYVLAPFMLLLLHFSILLNYKMHIKRLDEYKQEIDNGTLTVDPSLYGYAYEQRKRGFGGLLINFFLWGGIYLTPLLILVIIYHVFAAYHDGWVTLWHFSIIWADIFIILVSFYFNIIYFKDAHRNVRGLANIYMGIIFLIGILSFEYGRIFINPVYSDYNKMALSDIEDEAYPKFICTSTFKFSWSDKWSDNNITLDCFPRLIVNEAEMAKISPDALYIPRFMLENYKPDQNLSNEIIGEKELILKYGARTNLKRRNLRYADLSGCILTRADLRDSHLQGANLQKSHLQAADLSYAKLQDANLALAKLDKTDFSNAKLMGAKLIGATSKSEVYFSGSNLTDADMTSVELESAKFDLATLVRTNMSKAILSSADYTGADLTGASFRGSTLNDINFYHATAIGIDFSYVTSNVPFNIIMNLAKKKGGIIINESNNFNIPDKAYGFDKNSTDNIIVIEDENEMERYQHFHLTRISDLDKGARKNSANKKELSNILENYCKRLKYLADRWLGRFKKDYEEAQKICNKDNNDTKKYAEKTDKARN